MKRSPGERCHDLLVNLYGAGPAAALQTRLEDRLAEFAKEMRRAGGSQKDAGLSERDAILITYGDMLQEVGRPPLQSLAAFAHKFLEGVVSGIHILPFFPWSSDDGFSVIDYRAVEPGLGNWEDLQRLSGKFRLMFDAVINHVSAESDWFQAFLRGDPRYRDFFILPGEDWDLSKVIRPRTTPLLTPFEGVEGVKKVWTTFSADQVDLNYHDPGLFFEMVDLMLFYIQQGAQLIRLDAIAFIWKEPGTTCLHLPQAHQVVQLLRAIFDWAAPNVRILTETNVPHADNVAYFGDGTNEAQLVYNFPLPPLALHTFRTRDCRALSDWAAGLRLPSKNTTFFNFLASHDGIGLNPARGIIEERDVQALVAQTEAHGGFINHKTNPDGTSSPYELNVNFYDALNDPTADEPLELQVSRFVCSQAIMLAMLGVPGIYFHSLVGSRGWPEGVKIRGYHRAINRQKLARAELEARLERNGSRQNRVFRAYAHLLSVRARAPAFDPHGTQRVIDCGPGVFGLARQRQGGAERPLICLHNVTPQNQPVVLDASRLDLNGASTTDLVSGTELRNGKKLVLQMRPYQVMWLQAKHD